MPFPDNIKDMDRYFLPFLLFCGTLFFGYLFLQEPAPRRQVSTTLPKSGSISYTQLQQMKKETAIKVGLRKQRALMDKRVQGPELDPSFGKKKKFHKTELNTDPHPVSGDLDDGSLEEAYTLDQRMDEFLAEKQRYEQLEESKKRLYVRQFIQEAYKMGFNVQVNESLEVVSVKKREDQ
ncbi:MAG: hypothetical protein AAF203_08210 [Pseudomonadota bacterium]